MAVRVYRAPRAPQALTSVQVDTLAPLGRVSSPRATKRSFSSGVAPDVFEEAHADSHIIERKVKKEHRAGRRELEAARRQQRELRDDDDFEHEEF